MNIVNKKPNSSALKNRYRPDTPIELAIYYLNNIFKKLEKFLDKKELEDFSNGISLIENLQPYLEKYSENENYEPLNELLKITKEISWDKLYEEGKTKKLLTPMMITGPYECLFLKLIVKLLRSKKILDLGMFTGYSSLAMASALPENGIIVACEKEPYLSEFVGLYLKKTKYEKKIKIIQGQAIETMKILIKKKASFDLIFIDADKYEYLDYYKLIMDSKLLKPHGIICVDNTLMKGLVYGNISNEYTDLANEIHKFNTFVKNDKRVNQIIIPIRDGVSLIWRAG